MFLYIKHNAIPENNVFIMHNYVQLNVPHTFVVWSLIKIFIITWRMNDIFSCMLRLPTRHTIKTCLSNGFSFTSSSHVTHSAKNICCWIIINYTQIVPQCMLHDSCLSSEEQSFTEKKSCVLKCWHALFINYANF